MVKAGGYVGVHLEQQCLLHNVDMRVYLLFYKDVPFSVSNLCSELQLNWSFDSGTLVMNVVNIVCGHIDSDIRFHLV